MASPQIEDGYTKIANEIMDALCKIRIPGEERQILDAILRKTYGWNKCEDHISLSQFAESTGMNKPHIIQSIKGLLLKKVITVTENSNGFMKLYKFNKNYDQWVPLPKKVMLPKTVKSITENGNKSLPKTVPTKEKKEKKESAPFFLPEYIPPETWQAYMAVRVKKRASQTPYAFNLIIKTLEKIKREYGQNPIDVLNKSIASGWSDVYPIKENGQPVRQGVSW
jgi:phage replication O-like protein O